MRLQLIYQHAPTEGAPGIYRHRILLAELVKRGWDVDLISSPINYMTGEAPERYRRKWFVSEEIDGINHHWVWALGNVHKSFKRRALNYVTFATNAALRGITLPKPDIVMASSPPLSVATAGKMVARRFRCPWVLEVRDLWPESAAAVGLLSEDGRAYKVIDRFARNYAKTANNAIVPTPGLINELKSHGADNVDLVTGVIQNNPPSPEQRSSIRKKHGIEDDAIVFSYVGAHGVVNGLDILIDAAIELDNSSSNKRDTHILMAGAGSDFSRIKSRIDEVKLDNIHLLGPVDKPVVRELLSATDVGLHMLKPEPIFHTALPTKVLEYLGSHLPFITTVPGLPEKVATESGGSFVANSSELAHQMTEWSLLSQSELKSKGEQAFIWGDKNYGLKASADALESALRRAFK